MEGDTVATIQKDFLHHVAGLIDAFNRAIDLVAPGQTVLIPVAMQIRAQVETETPHGGADSTQP